MLMSMTTTTKMTMMIRFPFFRKAMKATIVLLPTLGVIYLLIFYIPPGNTGYDYFVRVIYPMQVRAGPAQHATQTSPTPNKKTTYCLAPSTNVLSKIAKDTSNVPNRSTVGHLSDRHRYQKYTNVQRTLHLTGNQVQAKVSSHTLSNPCKLLFAATKYFPKTNTVGFQNP